MVTSSTSKYKFLLKQFMKKAESLGYVMLFRISPILDPIACNDEECKVTDD